MRPGALVLRRSPLYIGATDNGPQSMNLRQTLRDMKETLRLSAGDLDSRRARVRAWLHFLIFDHAILRLAWTNEAEIAPGVFRANHPSPSRLRRLAARGMRAIVNLRGVSDAPHYVFEREACAQYGLPLVDFEGLTARTAPPRAVLLAFMDLVRRTEKPFLMHCKSGADRSSLAAVIYLLAVEGASIRAARAQLSPLFIHFRWTKTGVLDAILDSYAAAHAASGIGFEEWVRTDYDATAIQARFDARR